MARRSSLLCRQSDKMTLRAPPLLVAAVITAAEKMSLNRMNSAHNFITFFCTYGVFYGKAPHILSFQLISLFSCPKGFYHSYFVLSSLFLFPSLWSLEHCSLSGTHHVSLCMLFSCMLATSVTLSWPFPLSFTSLHFEILFPPSCFALCFLYPGLHAVTWTGCLFLHIKPIAFL